MENALIQMLESISGKKLDNISRDCSLFSAKLGLSARDITYFLIELEEKYRVVFSSEKINDQSFFTMENIINELQMKKET